MNKKKLLSQKGITISTNVAIIFVILSFASMAFYWGSWFRSYQARQPKEVESIEDIEGTPIEINISSEPSGAQIILDNKDVGKTTPALLSGLQYVSHKISLTHDEAQDWTGMLGTMDPLTKTITIKANMNKK